MTSAKEKDTKNSVKKAEPKDQQNKGQAPNQLNFYKPSEGSSDNLAQNNPNESDVIHDSGEIIFQNGKTSQSQQIDENQA